MENEVSRIALMPCKAEIDRVDSTKFDPPLVLEPGMHHFLLNAETGKTEYDGKCEAKSGEWCEKCQGYGR